MNPRQGVRVVPFLQEVGGKLFDTEATLLALFIIIILVGIAARYYRLPYTTILVIAGLGLEFLGFLPKIELTPEVVLLLFLPPLAFEAAFHLDLEKLRQDVTPVAVFALFGVMVSMVVAGAVLVFALGFPVEIALLFGTLIAATDPVSVVAVFRELGVAKRLSVLMESESLFNDGTSIVLFRLALAVVLTGAFHPIEGLVEFLRLVLGGMALGFGLGYLTSRFLARIEDYLIEISMTVVLAWGSYLLGEYLGVSGVISVVVAGLVLGNYGGRISFSPTTKLVLEHVLEFVSFVANSFIFLLIGLQVSLIDLRVNAAAIFVAIVAALLARAVTVYGLALPLRWIATPIPVKWQHLLFWGGLRGGVTLALALSLPATVPQRETLIIAAFSVVLFTLVVQGLTIRPLVQFLNLVPQHERQQNFEIMRARLLAARAADRRLARLHDQGAIAESTFVALRSDNQVLEQELAEQLDTLYGSYPELKQSELKTAQLESLRAQRSELFELNRRGMISDETYRQLTAQIDEQLHTLTTTEAERRAAASGPEAAVNGNSADE
jgi:CPA1 family monovalent cation:H+ antiporter